jgi:hypothetical protein
VLINLGALLRGRLHFVKIGNAAACPLSDAPKKCPADELRYLGKFGRGGPEKIDAAGKPAKLMRFNTAGPMSLLSFDREERELGLTLLGDD